MQEVTGNPATYHATISAPENGDTLNTATFLAQTQDIADNIAYLKDQLDGDRIWTGNETFEGNVIHSGAEGRTVWRYDDSHRSGGGLASFTADVAADSYEIGGNPSGADFVITMRNSTAPVPQDGERITIFKQNGANNATNKWLVKLESAALIATFPVGTAFGSVTLIRGGGQWRVESCSGAVTVP